MGIWRGDGLADDVAMCQIVAVFDVINDGIMFAHFDGHLTGYARSAI